MIKTSLPQKRREKKCPVFCLCHIADHYFFENVDRFVFDVKENKYSEI